MSKIVYLYTSGGAPKCNLNSKPHFDLSKQTTNRFAIAAPSDGMVNMFKLLVKKHLIDRLTVLVDSTISPGTLQLGIQSHLHVVPSMSWAEHFINPGDILIVRGGFKSWYPLLDYIYNKRKNWILFYRANTNRHAWKFWDIILNDLVDKPIALGGRLHYNFSKPVNEEIFGIIDAPGTLPREYDVMIGASHIHKKKGQHITVQALQEYYRIYGVKPHAIMPGGYLRGQQMRIIKDIIQTGDVDIEGPVNLTRQHLALAMNRTKLFVHPGYGGQNDRGILEAMCCGCLPLLFGRSHISPIIYDNAIHISQNPTDIAKIINQALDTVNNYDKNTYSKINGFDKVVMPKMLDLLSFIDNNPIPDRVAACARFITEKNVLKIKTQILT